MVAKTEMKECFREWTKFSERWNSMFFRFITKTCVSQILLDIRPPFIAIFESVGIQNDFCVFLYFRLICWKWWVAYLLKKGFK